LFLPVSISTNFPHYLTALSQELSCCAIKVARLKPTIFYKRDGGYSAGPSGKPTLFGQLQFLNGV
jgi:hypothetical protein